jgi:hypothetical protein
MAPTSLCCSASCSRDAWRGAKQRRSLREVSVCVRIDEASLGVRICSMFATAEETMRGQVQSGIPMHQAQQAVTFEFNRAVQHVCMKTLQERDMALIHYAKQGADALLTLQRVGALVPPWLLSRARHRTVQQQLEELAEMLDGSREQREYDLRARVVRIATQTQYNQLRPTPESLFDPDVAHVIRCVCVPHSREFRRAGHECTAWLRA